VRNRKCGDMRLSVQFLIARCGNVRFNFVQPYAFHILLHPLSKCQNVVFNGERLIILLYFCQWHFPKEQEGCCSHEAVKCQSDDSMLSNSLRTVGDASRKWMRKRLKSPSIFKESFTCMGFSQRRYSENKNTRVSLQQDILRKRCILLV